MGFYLDVAAKMREMKKKKRPVEEVKHEVVHLQYPGQLPDDYHCNCAFCTKFLGVLMRRDGTFYNKLDRNRYYSKGEQPHVAKTPLHVARWCIQRFSKPGDWVLDPTMGAGTTAVEAVNHGRNAAGVELQFSDIVLMNLGAQTNVEETEVRIESGDARELRKLLWDNWREKPKFKLVVNNPPYSGDEAQKVFKVGGKKAYDHSIKENLAFLKENDGYYQTMGEIYAECVEMMEPGGHICIGVKDMCRNKQPYMLHYFLSMLLHDNRDLDYVGMALLPHYTPTLFMSTYGKKFPEAMVPRYQTITVFKKN